MDNISEQKALNILSDVFLYTSECIDFKTLKEIFSELKIEFTKVTKNIAYNIVHKDIPIVHIFEDDELPF